MGRYVTTRLVRLSTSFFLFAIHVQIALVPRPEKHMFRAHFPASRKNNALPSVRSLIWVVTRTWENVVEGADGTISSTIEGLLEAGKRKR